jgi:toxin FitB
MIVIDTNVISEFFNSTPDAKVMKWFSSQTLNDLFISVPTTMELWSGAYRLPEGRKRQILDQKISHHTNFVFRDRILELNVDAAKLSGELLANQFMAGLQADIADCQIAAIAISNGFSLATRNIKHFQHERLTVINPWESN